VLLLFIFWTIDEYKLVMTTDYSEKPLMYIKYAIISSIYYVVTTMNTGIYGYSMVSGYQQYVSRFSVVAFFVSEQKRKRKQAMKGYTVYPDTRTAGGFTKGQMNYYGTSVPKVPVVFPQSQPTSPFSYVDPYMQSYRSSRSHVHIPYNQKDKISGMNHVPNPSSHLQNNTGEENETEEIDERDDADDAYEASPFD
jgi:hypothetical protein